MSDHANTLLASHDAGGAEILSAWAKTQARGGFRYCLEGPALGIFRRKLGEIPELSRVEALASPEPFARVILTTSWGSDLEASLLRQWKGKAGRVISYLDHWIAYAERFTALPDELWVGDADALKLAQRVFPGVPIRLEPNRYFEEMTRAIRLAEAGLPARSTERARVLYLTQPTSRMAKEKMGDPRHYGYTEEEALAECLGYLVARRREVEAVRIRLHPAETEEKYSPIVAPFRKALALELGKSRPLAEDCAWADWVVGCDSMGLVIGLMAGKKVFSCIPARGRPCSLPQKGIVHLFR